MKKKITPKDNKEKQFYKKTPCEAVFSDSFMNGDSMWYGEERLKKFVCEWKNKTLQDHSIRRPYAYPVSLGIDPDTIRYWREKHDFVEVAYNTVKEIIYQRESIKLDDYNPNHISKILPDLSHEYKEQYEWQANLKAKTIAPVQEIPNPVQTPLDNK